MKRMELICGLVVAFLGALTLGALFFLPTTSYSETISHGSLTISSSGVTSSVQANGLGLTFLTLLLFGFPIAGVTLGSFLDQQKRFFAGKLILWISTIAFLVLVGLSLASIGLFLLPTLALALATSLLAIPVVFRRKTNGTNTSAYNF